MSDTPIIDQALNEYDQGSSLNDFVLMIEKFRKLERGLAEMTAHVRWLLPMAKGWAHENKVGQNMQIVIDAEAAIAAQSQDKP